MKADPKRTEERRRAGLAGAARSRLRSGEGQADLFAADLRRAQLGQPRGAAVQYEREKGVVRRRAKGCATKYERGIKRMVKRIRY